MNVPAQTNVSAVSSSVISAARCALLFATVQNTSGAVRYYLLADASSLPALNANGRQPAQGIMSPGIPAGQTWRAFNLDSTFGNAFTNGVVLMSFAADANNNPIFGSLSAADANVVAWSAALQ
jgi:hypothetical protein